MRRSANVEQRAWLIRLLRAVVTLATLLASSVCVAAEPSVMIGRPASPTPLLNEVLIRMRGELTAAGLSTDTRVWERRMGEGAPVLPRETYGAVVFEQDRTRIAIWAYAPDSEDPITLTLDTRARHVNAEVVAVRAVEALRAAIHRYAEGARQGEEELPQAVREFGESTPPAPPAPDQSSSVPEKTAPVEEPPVEVALAPAPAPLPAPQLPLEDQWRLTFQAGPSLALDGGALAGGVGAGLGIDRGWFGARVLVDAALSPYGFAGPAGVAHARRTAGSLQAGGVWRPSARFFLLGTIGGGVANYAIEGDAGPGFTAVSTDHWTPYVAARVSGQFHLTSGFALYVDAEPSVVANAPVLRVGGVDVAKLGQPAFVGGAGVLIALQLQ